MPSDNKCFVTGGSDHAVVLWKENEEKEWKSQTMHNLHTSAVMGVTAMIQKSIVLSVGQDKNFGVQSLGGRRRFYPSG